MSVINQMLKDLEQRAPEQGQAPVPAIQNQKPSTVKIVVVSIVVLLAINVLGFYIWDLNNRVTSSELKTAQLQKASESKLTVSEKKSSDESSVESSVKSSKTIEEKTLGLEQKTAQAKHVEKDEQLLESKVERIAEVNNKVNNNAATVESESSVLPNKTVDSQTVQKQSIRNQSAQSQVGQSKVVENRAVQQKTLQNKAILGEQENAALSANVADEKLDKKPSKMTVSRRQLTPSELVEQKLSKAEKAVNANEIAKAEKLFEEVLIIEPNNKEARKKLAALWFGRKSYQQALNLLSQGISLDKQDSELRLLKARIQLQQGQHDRAHQTLRPLAHLEQQDYQVMLANVAQQIEAYESAIIAYKLLIKMQPYSGKWHLGIAITYDKNSQFTLAEQAYAKALSKHDLSKASAEFAQQRMQALGE